MTAVMVAPKRHKIGKPVMLSKADIDNRRAELERKYGDADMLRRKKVMGAISADEFMALQRFDDLDYLEGE